MPELLHSKGGYHIFCDCQSALNQLWRNTYSGLKDFLAPDYDLLNEGRSLYKQLKEVITVTLSWVRGHHKGEKVYNTI